MADKDAVPGESTTDKVEAAAKKTGGNILEWIEGHPGLAFAFAVGVIFGWILKTLLG